MTRSPIRLRYWIVASVEAFSGWSRGTVKRTSTVVSGRTSISVTLPTLTPAMRTSSPVSRPEMSLKIARYSTRSPGRWALVTTPTQ